MDNFQNEVKHEKEIFENQVELVNDLPTLSIDTKSANAVALLKDFIFSKCGVFTRINNYYYQSWLTNKTYRNLSKDLNEIALESSNVLSILSEAVLLFGGNPNFSNSNGAYWSGAYINKTSNPAKFLVKNIEQEKCIIVKIRKLQNEINNDSLKVFFDSVVFRKLKFIKTFEDYLSNLN